MSDIMRPIPLAQLIKWVQCEYKNHGSVFGVKKENFFYPSSHNVEVFGKKTSVPIGPASGPHTQLAQNILASFLAGGRFMELKTVQTLDGEELRKALSRPSINAAREGYNIEWSTELTVPEALEEYIKAWFLCHIFAVEFNICEKADVIFTMNAGYSLDGIKSEKIDFFIEGMKNAQNTSIWQKCYGQIEACLSSFAGFTQDSLDSIPSEISDSIIISTFNNCPVDETEKIALFFINDKKLHTYIKCNPTLPGFETAREILDNCGYGHISFNEQCFKDDIQFNDALKMLRRLKTAAAKTHTGFGVKLTNTLPVEIKQNELPGKTMYLSGRALFPLSICTAKKISEAFHGEMPVSYSGGADFFNLKDILETGICPVTMVTNSLKPGGAARFNQLARLCEEISPDTRSVNVKALNALCEKAANWKHYRGDYRKSPLKIPGPPPFFNCRKAPCADGCPLEMKIPRIAAAVSGKDYNGAFKLIALDNSAPSITGTLCDNPCQEKCARLFYDDPLEIKRTHKTAAKIAQEYYNFSITASRIKTDESAAVIGAGAAGMAAAVFLRRNGVAVTVYEKRKHPYGAVQYLLPSFKISDDDIFRDYEMAVKTGVEFVFNAPEIPVVELKKKHRFVVIATGAWKDAETAIKMRRDVIPGAIGFLEDIKMSNYALNLGKKAAVLGGGSAAICCARAAIRNKGVESVTIIYNGTADTMPVPSQEKEQALAENIVICELLKGVSWEDGILICEQTAPDNCDGSGTGVSTAKKQELHFDTVISAEGVKVDTEQFATCNILLEGDFPVTNADLESSLSGVYIAGSCRTGILKTVNSVADGKKAAAGILKKLGINPDFSTGPSFAENEEEEKSAYLKKGVICESKNDDTDMGRCLSCDAVCEVCADVCPNRANIPVLVQAAGKAQDRQILHIDSMCNECGNCAVFCPYDGKPHKDKPSLFINEEDFEESENAGFLKTGKNTFKIRLQDGSVVTHRAGGKTISPEWLALIDTVVSKYGYLFPE
jgi:putative selenate reductase